jgi:putative ABC transport system ATP-binding protein
MVNVENNQIISIQNISKKYGKKGNQTLVLDNVSLDIQKGDFCLILGRSGSGKSTLLNLMAGLDRSSDGKLFVNGVNLSKLRQKQLSQYRSKVGIIFQNYSLLPNLSAVENVMMGSWVSGLEITKERAKLEMIKFGLGDRVDSKIETLSGGEKQRVAIVRAISNNKNIIFCDEPTGALDTKNELLVMQMLKELNNEGVTIVCVTHNPEFKNLANRVVEMSDGRIISHTQN